MVGLSAFTAMVPGSIPSRGTKIPQAVTKSYNAATKDLHPAQPKKPQGNPCWSSGKDTALSLPRASVPSLVGN